MKLKTLATDTKLVPTTLSLEDRSMRGGFIVIRVRQIRKAASDPEDIPDADVPALKTQLTTEISKADTTVQQILSLVKADETANVLYKLSDVDTRMKKAYISQGIVKSDLSVFRMLTVKIIGWWLLGDDFSLSTNINDLHYLVDRKLRITERMMYDVGRVDNRSWTKKTINADIAGNWKDGWNRMFEYPRISQPLFLSHCDPNTTTQVCKKPELSDWLVKGSANLSLVKTARVNPSANNLWEQQASNDYDFFFKSPSVNDPEVALNKLFTPSVDYKSRNLLFCDHVIHILHMEALLFSKKKRSADISWLKNYINNVDGKMRIYFLNDSANEYLAGPKDATFFKYKRVKVSELQIGDQLIVYNHPAYDKATVGGVWRLENALVVTIFPKLRLQGHGTHPLTFGQMKNIVVKLFNGEVDKLRARVESLIHSGSTDQEIDFGGIGKLILRYDSSMSNYSPAVRKADWWLRWSHDSEKEDAAIASDPQRKALAWQIHKVEYDNTYGYFPLWQPVTLNGNPIMKNGKTSKIQKVIITPEMIAGWTWNLPVDVKDREMSVVLRPKN